MAGIGMCVPQPLYSVLLRREENVHGHSIQNQSCEQLGIDWNLRLWHAILDGESSAAYCGNLLYESGRFDTIHSVQDFLSLLNPFFRSSDARAGRTCRQLR
jgi:hypothetical protein